jgi:uncharacterized protein
VTEYTLPLFELFTRLRQADVPLGIDEYTLLLRALQAGFGGETREELAQLCQMLWVKSDEDERLFRHHFKEVITSLPLNTSPTEQETSSTESSSITTTSQSEVEQTASSTDADMAIEKQAAKAVLHAVSEDEIPYNRFIRSDEYFPVTRRQMKQSWRYLRRPITESGSSLELDVPATINEVSRTGGLLQPIWLPRQKNRTELLLLIDHGGSMVPFHGLSRRLAETALHGGRLNTAGTYYFHNCPTTYLYSTPTYQGARSIKDVLDSLRDERTAILIFSDAGAARRGFSQTRLDVTKIFLDQLTKHFRYIAWLNPTPRSRWASTTAGIIQEQVAMFEFTRHGLDDAISLLRGRPTSFIRSKRYRHDK